MPCSRGMRSYVRHDPSASVETSIPEAPSDRRGKCCTAPSLRDAFDGLGVDEVHGFLPGRHREQRGLASLKDHRDPLTATDAERGDTEVDVAFGHLEEQRDEEACPAGANGMSDCDRTTVDVEAVLRDGELSTDGDRLGCKRFVELEEVDIAEFDPSFLERGAHRGNWAHPHD